MASSCRLSPRGHAPITGADSFHSVDDLIATGDGTRVTGLRFARPRVQALLAELRVLRPLPNGFANRDLRVLTAPLPGRAAEAVAAGQLNL